MTTGQKLLELRRKEGNPSQAEMAWRVFGREITKNAAQSKWNRLETDKQEMTIQELQDICRYFKLPTGHFIQGEVMPPCGLIDHAQVETVCNRIGRLYQMPDCGAVQTFEYGLKWICDLAEREAMLNEIKGLLNTLIADNAVFNERLDHLEKLVKEGTPPEKAVVAEPQREAAVESTNSLKAGGP
jgi:hypothetical protein